MEKYVEFTNISKVYPGVKALDDISFRAEGGRVTALLGENGAGKSTLLKILSGDIQPSEGKLTINGEEKMFNSPMDSLNSGISVIYQERQLVPMLSVAENIFLDKLPKKSMVFLDKAYLRKATQEIIDKFGLPIDPDEPVAKLSVAYQQMVEIMKSYRRNSDIIAFDEPTAPLADSEITILFKLIEQLKDEGKVIFYVSHRMAEIFAVTDDVVVMKDGKFVTKVATADTTESELIKAMVGRDIGDTYANLQRNNQFGETVLEVKNLNTDFLENINFSLKRGEILGFAGLVGAGRTEVARAIFGADSVISGEILVKGTPVQLKSPKGAIAHGIGLCPEDRKEQGLILRQSIAKNVTMPVLKKIKTGLFLDKKQENELADEAVQKYEIRTPSIDKITAELSGGNQQKVILGRWTSSKFQSDILILDEPTKGIDVKTKAEIYQVICNLAKEGKGIIFISSELTEVINLCDNIIVMHEGRITGTIARNEATEENVLAMAMHG